MNTTPITTQRIDLRSPPQIIELPIQPFETLACCPLTRELLTRSMPNWLSMYYSGDYQINVDWRWLTDVIEQIPQSDWHVIKARIQNAANFVSAHIDGEPFLCLLGKMINDINISRGTQILREQDVRRQDRRLPGFMALFRHALGIESVNPFEHIVFNVTISGESCTMEAPLKITAVSFKAATGREPRNDDLDRVNCTKAGQIGHWACGWCAQCNRPRFECGHLLQQPT